MMTLWLVMFVHNAEPIPVQRFDRIEACWSRATELMHTRVHRASTDEALPVAFGCEWREGK